MVQAISFKKQGLVRHAWNIDGKVGLSSPNKEDDVQFVQFGYFCMLSKFPGLSAPEKTAFGAIVLGSRCTGVENDPLVLAIRAHQASRGGAQDGVVSPLSATPLPITTRPGSTVSSSLPFKTRCSMKSVQRSGRASRSTPSARPICR